MRRRKKMWNFFLWFFEKKYGSYMHVYSVLWSRRPPMFPINGESRASSTSKISIALHCHTIVQSRLLKLHFQTTFNQLTLIGMKLTIAILTHWTCDNFEGWHNQNHFQKQASTFSPIYKRFETTLRFHSTILSCQFSLNFKLFP